MEEGTFRPATAADLEAIVALINKCFGQEDTVEYARAAWEKTEGDPNQIYVNGYLGNVLVAHLKITLIPTIYDDMGTYAILNHVCVHPDYRRHHLGTKLLDATFQICRDHGVKKVELWSNNIREAAHAMYKHYGFKVADAKFFEYEI